MQNLHARAGARGWPWRIERIESFNRAAGARFLHMARQSNRATETLLAIQPFEPIARIEWRDELRPIPPSAALAIVQDSTRGQQSAFSIAAAERLNGDIHPWQLAAALVFERGHHRVLVADAAGMGKTVSAGLAIAQCLDGSADRRCLVLAPGHLFRQWQAELHHRLAIEALIVDAAALDRMQREVPAGVPVWLLPGCLIASIDFLKQPHVLKSLERILWDLLVIDEAHLACGLSERRDAADLIARRSRRLLLLTATPSDGGGDRLRALVSLGAANEPLIHLRHPAVTRARVERRVWVAPAAATSELHDALSAYTDWIAGGPQVQSPGIALLCSVLIKRALSSAHALQISLARRLALIGRDSQDMQPSLFDPCDDPGVLGACTGHPIERERRRLDTLLALAKRGARNDRRLAVLVRLVRRAREPVVIFSCFRDTALLVADHLAPHAAVRLVHGDLPQAVIEGALQAFTEGPAQVLVATDVAAQGLNLHQRCRWVVHYDLPWRPPTVRQRTGRVDRLGQTRRAHATFLIDRTPLASALFDRMTALTERMHADERGGSRRWNVLAAAEARRVRHLRAPDLPATAPPVQGNVTVVEIEYVDEAGMTVERSVAAVGAGQAAALEWAARRQALRRRQLRCRLLVRAVRRTHRERAVLASALASVPSAMRQDGLFDRRADRVRRDHTEARAHLNQAASEALERYAQEARIAQSRARVVATFHIPEI